MNYLFDDIPLRQHKSAGTIFRGDNIPNSPLTIRTPVDIIHRACGINSVVECHLAKVKVASPNLVFRSTTEPFEGFPLGRFSFYHP